MNSLPLARVCNNRILISVIINYYAKGSVVFDALECLNRQKSGLFTPAEMEIIIVDDGTEGEDIVERLPSNVIYLWQKKHQYGICRAKNTGARLANGRYLAFLDPDIMVGAHYLDAMLRGFRKYGDRVIQCGYIHDYFYGGCPDPREAFGVWENPGVPNNRFYQLAGGTMAMARSLYEETPGFDEDLVYGEVEDILFGWQLSRLSGTAMCFNREMEMRHRPHPMSQAHGEPDRCWRIARKKYPEFYDEQVFKGLR